MKITGFNNFNLINWRIASNDISNEKPGSKNVKFNFWTSYFLESFLLFLLFNRVKLRYVSDKSYKEKLEIWFIKDHKSGKNIYFF